VFFEMFPFSHMCSCILLERSEMASCGNISETVPERVVYTILAQIVRRH